jgi:hypothetical protein
VALAIALPIGVFLGGRQSRRLAGSPEPITRWAFAFGTCLLMLGLVLLRSLGTGSAQLGVLGLSAVAAYGVTELAIRRPAVLGRLGALPSSVPVVVGVSAVAIMLALFIGVSVASPGQLVASLVLAAVGLAAVLVLDRGTIPALRRRLLDVVLCVVLAMVVFQLKLLPLDSYIHHQNFYLGPVNDMAHGRAMLVDVWAQYGVGSYYALLAALSVLPRNHGGVVLLMSMLMAAQYVLVYATLRIAVRSHALVVAALGAAVLSSIFGNLGSYAAYPSIGPLRFGLPYLVVAAAVAAARWPERARAMRMGQLILVAIAAVWSFETFVYTAVTWSAVAALIAFGRPNIPLRSGLRVFVREVGAAAGVSVLALLALTIGTRVTYGAWPVWGGYLDYVRLYSASEFGTLRIDFWSPALLMAAAIFLSAVGVIWVARDDRARVSAPVLVGLAGFTAFAASTFTYFLGRSHPNNLLNLLVPVCALGCLWASVLLAPREQGHRAWRVLPLAFLLWVAAVLAVYGWPFAEQRWQGTAFAQAVPFADGHAPGATGATSLRKSLTDLWKGQLGNDTAIEGAARLLERYVPGDGPVLVVEPAETDILLKADRINLLPISNPEQDSLIMPRVWPRVVAAIDRVPDGTILLTSAFEPKTSPPILQSALEELHRRFDFKVLETSPEGFQVVRLQSRR